MAVIDTDRSVGSSKDLYLARRKIASRSKNLAGMELISNRRNSRFETDTSIFGSPAEEVVREPALRPDTDITHCYDAAHASNHEGQIFHMALAKAIERYETQSTEKLIEEEYEVVRKEKADASTEYAAHDNDFELI